MIMPIDEAVYAAADIGFTSDGRIATFVLPIDPSLPGEPPSQVTVTVVGDDLHLFPERSSGQKRLLAMLGK